MGMGGQVSQYFLNALADVFGARRRNHVNSFQYLLQLIGGFRRENDVHLENLVQIACMRSSEAKSPRAACSSDVLKEASSSADMI